MLGFTSLGDGEYRLDGAQRRFHWAYDAPAGGGRAGRGHRPPHRLGARATRTTSRGRSASRRRRVRDRRARPRLLPLDLLPRAARRAVRDRHALARLRGRRGPGAPRRGAAPARPSTSTCASSSSARSTPVENPRARCGSRERARSTASGPPPASPSGLLVLHHGRGADEHDLLGLADVLDPERRLHVVTPRAPLQLPGWPGNHWYVVPRVGYPDHDTFHAAYAALAELPRRAVGAHRRRRRSGPSSAASRWAR